LHHGPDTGLPREGVELIGTLAYIANQAFKRIGAANGALHQLRKGVNRQEMVLELQKKVPSQLLLAQQLFLLSSYLNMLSLILLSIFPTHPFFL
jgi:hypothetical protein